MFDCYEAGEQAILVHINFTQEDEWEDLSEFEMLVLSASMTKLQTVIGRRQSPHAKYFIGEGKALEIADTVRMLDAEIVIFNHSLSPAQERNLERLVQCRVLSRTDLILGIFAQRARTHEGKLQVELAQLRHLSTRLIRGWTHLERQKGGIGLRGPGESQLETDRRLLRERMKVISRRLHKVVKQREQARRARTRAEVPTVSLVGYTNSGKSTLFNRITKAGVYVADQLFATLDPTLREIEVKNVGKTIMADTVGFIRHLPHDLVAAFQATLQEIQEATLLLHVIDASNENVRGNIKAVNVILEEIQASEVPTLLIMNKIDSIGNTYPRIERDHEGIPRIVWVSALANLGIDLLFEALTERLAGTMASYRLRVPPATIGKIYSEFCQLQCIIYEKYESDGSLLVDVRLPQTHWMRLKKREGSKLGDFIVNEQTVTV
ncbi:ribosome rescue GTPase HflX [Candidatus Enterovibrio altilux]|uniref:GTPase HflX n=1 Tax=Candidatus Enterovibrio altilux TaxID=1927128 RepID=A0A291B8Z5_9GAMM|nr:ribosome rescue GTPase HflX [Candidatus Enterovibrio luxaltus]ATF09461.1 GTP-binding protein HflX [Candidatus Enterovibrio luxaltus]